MRRACKFHRLRLLSTHTPWKTQNLWVIFCMDHRGMNAADFVMRAEGLLCFLRPRIFLLDLCTIDNTGTIAKDGQQELCSWSTQPIDRTGNYFTQV